MGAGKRAGSTRTAATATLKRVAWASCVPSPSPSTRPTLSGGLGELVLDRLLKGQELLHARPLQHALEMRRAVLEAREVQLELPRSPLAPEEVRVRRREVVEEE